MNAAVVPEELRAKVQRIVDAAMRALLDELEAVGRRGPVVIAVGNTSEIGGLNIATTEKRTKTADVFADVALLMGAQFREEWRGKTRNERLEKLIDDLYGTGVSLGEQGREAHRELLARTDKQFDEWDGKPPGPFTPEMQAEIDKAALELLIDECLEMLREIAAERATLAAGKAE